MDPRLRAAVDASRPVVRRHLRRAPDPGDRPASRLVRVGRRTASGTPPSRRLAPEAGMDDVLACDRASRPRDGRRLVRGPRPGGARLRPRCSTATWLHRPTGSRSRPVGLPMALVRCRGHRRARRVEPAPRDRGGAGPRASRPSDASGSSPGTTRAPLIGGAVTRDDAAPTVGLSNAWSAPGRHLDWPERPVTASARCTPADLIVDYAWGDDLEVMRAARVQPVGSAARAGLVEQRVRLERRPPVVLLAARSDELEPGRRDQLGRVDLPGAAGPRRRRASAGSGRRCGPPRVRVPTNAIGRPSGSPHTPQIRLSAHWVTRLPTRSSSVSPQANGVPASVAIIRAPRRGCGTSRRARYAAAGRSSSVRRLRLAARPTAAPAGRCWSCGWAATAS